MQLPLVRSLGRLAVFRLGLLVSLLIVGAIFSIVLRKQAQTFDTELLRIKHAQSGLLRELPKWNVTLYDCIPGGACVRSGDSIEVILPSQAAAWNEFSQLVKGRAVARLEYLLNDADRNWLEGRQMVSLVLPRNIQMVTRLVDSSEPSQSQGVGTHTEFALSVSALKKAGVISLEIDYSDLPYFGPMDVPIALCDGGVASVYQAISERQLGAQALQMQLGIGFRLNLAAMALVLDHSTPFGMLSFYGAARALRSLIPFVVESGVPYSRGLDFAFSSIGGVCFVTLILFLCYACGVELEKRRRALAVLVLGAVVLSLVPLVDPKSWIRSDLYCDLMSSGMGISIVVYALWKTLLSFKGGEGEPRVLWFSSVETRHLVILRLTILLVALSLSFWINGVDLARTFSEGAFKAIADWRHSLLIPLLTVAALLEVGFTSRKVQSVAREMTEKAIQDHDLETARAHQRSLLPPLRSAAGNVSWRGYYRPAAQVAGDWFDVREIHFADGRSFLAVALVDVTGHGVAAALSTTVFASFWSLWCCEAAALPAPDSHEAKESALCEAAARIHRGLTACRQAGSGTAVFLLFDLEKTELTVCCAGHQSPVLVGKGGLRTVSIAGPGLGFPGTDLSAGVPWSATSFALESGEEVLVYSDGVFADLDHSRRWVRDMKRKLAKGDVNPALQLLGHMRASRAVYRQDRSLEDDMTLVVFRVGSRASQ